MNHAFFVSAAYAICIVGVGWLLISSFFAMRRSEALAEDLRQKP